MLNFLPFFLIILMIIGLMILQRTHLPIGTIWLLLVVFALINWFGMLLLHSHLPDALVIKNWFPLSLSSDTINLHLGEDNWFLFFAMNSLLVGILLASSTYLQSSDIFKSWFGVLALSSIGMLALLADSPLAFIFMWALIDVIEIIVFTIINRDQTLSIQTSAVFLGRILGLGLVLVAMILANQSQSPLELSSANGGILSLLIAGACLRLGVLPIHLPYTQDLVERRNLGTILRILAPLSAIEFLSKLAVPQSVHGIDLTILLLAFVSCLFGALNWFSSQNELDGRPYWILSFSGLAVMAYFHGQSNGVIIWGTLMVIIGGWVFLSESHPRKIDPLLPVALLAISGIPFTPSSFSMTGLVTDPLKVFNPFIWLSLAFLMAGMVKFSTGGRNEARPLENWMKLFSLLGMTILVLSPWTIILFKVQGWNQTSFWWVALILLLVFSVIISIKYVHFIKARISNSQVNKLFLRFFPFGKAINHFFHFEWIYPLFAFLFNIFRRIVNELNLILAGEGGILWALVFLALLVSLLVNGRGG
jgi:hypothetical protein